MTFFCSLCRASGILPLAQNARSGPPRLPKIKVKGRGRGRPRYTTLGCFLYVLKLGDLDGCLREVGGGFSSPSRGLRKFWSVVPDRSGRGPGLLAPGLKPHFLWASTARLKAAPLQNNIKIPPLQSNIKIPSGRRTWNPAPCTKRKERATRLPQSQRQRTGVPALHKPWLLS